MEVILIAALLILGGANSGGPSAPAEFVESVEAQEAAIAQTSMQSEAFSIARLKQLSNQIKPKYLKFVISYIRNPKTTPGDIVWTVNNWDSKQIRRMMPRKIHKELTGFIVKLQDLSREELLMGITLIKTSQHSSRTLAKIITSPSG